MPDLLRTTTTKGATTPMRYYVQLELHNDGSHMNKQLVTEELEFALENLSFDLDGSNYGVSVSGIGTSLKTLGESTNLRTRQHVR